MDGNPLTLAKILLPRLPSILYLTITNRLGYSPCSPLQTAQTEIVVSIIKSLLGIPKPLSVLQTFGTKDPGVRGPMWIVTARCEAAGGEVRDVLMRAVRELGEPGLSVEVPGLVDVEGEWTGFRGGSTGAKDPMPMLGGEAERYAKLLEECTSQTVVLYCHGGAHFMMDPISHRQITSSLARKTGGRVFSLRYRLSPQNPFPCALLDALTAYLYLTSPPPDALHTAISPSHIVLAGDSAGGQLSFSLATLLLHLTQQNIHSVPFHTHSHAKLTPPAALALNSPWLDISRSAPSTTTNAKYDYIDPPSHRRAIPHDHVWPTAPPRAEIFCAAAQLTHPLVSPITTPQELLTVFPPVWMCCGTEGLTDEIVLMAQRLDRAGRRVELIGYEGMPHCFAMIFQKSSLSRDCIDRWAGFIRRFAVEEEEEEEKHEREKEGKTVALWAKAKCERPIVWEKIPLGDVRVGVGYEGFREMMEVSRRIAVEREEELRREYFAERAGRAKL